MGKGGSRGLPSSFSLQVPTAVLSGPVQLGEYLDEEDVAVPRRVNQPPQQPAPQPAHPRPEQPKRQPPPHSGNPSPPNVVPMPRIPAPVSEAIPGPVAEEAVDDATTFTPRRANRVARKQLNMNAETLRMVDELLDYIQSYSGQKDAKASEMFHGLVAALYEAKDLLDFVNVPARGRWGTPTARAFPIALKNSFQKAIANWYARNR